MTGKFQSNVSLASIPRVKCQPLGKKAKFVNVCLGSILINRFDARLAA